MTTAFAIIALLTVASAVCAMALRNLVHCALSLVVTFAGLAALFLQLNAQFVGFAQILVYVGAVAILIVFAILLTRSADPGPPEPVATSPWWGCSSPERPSRSWPERLSPVPSPNTPSRPGPGPPSGRLAKNFFTTTSSRSKSSACCSRRR